jgi:hypothetical protein
LPLLGEFFGRRVKMGIVLGHPMGWPHNPIVPLLFAPNAGNAVFYFLFEQGNQFLVGIYQSLLALDLRNDLLLDFERGGRGI